MINFRLKAAGYNSLMDFFTDEAVAGIYRYTQGYPRKIAMLCHNALKLLTMENKSVVDAKVVNELIAKDVAIAV